MKGLKALFFSSYLFLAGHIHAVVINFTFDLYLSQLHAPDISQQKGYKQLVNLIWEQAQYLASAHTYGLRFTYFAPRSWEIDTPNFSLTPQALISRGNKNLSIRNVQRLSPFHFKVGARYVLTCEETKRYRHLQKKATTLPSTQGYCEYNHEITFFKEALENSFFNAIRTYALERNLSQFEGLLLLKENQPLLIKSGFALQNSQIQLIIESPTSFGL